MVFLKTPALFGLFNHSPISGTWSESKFFQLTTDTPKEFGNTSPSFQFWHGDVVQLAMPVRVHVATLKIS